MYGNSVFSSVLEISNKSYFIIISNNNGSVVCANVSVFVCFWNENNCGMFSKMGFCVSVEGNVVHVLFGLCLLLRYLMFMPIGCQHF